MIQLKSVLNKTEMKSAQDIAAGKADILDHPRLYEKLYHALLDEMPYGVQKARTGDPYEWVFSRLCGTLLYQRPGE